MSSTTPNANGDGEPTITTEADPWEQVGRDLLRTELERVAETTVRNAFRRATRRISQSEELTREDIRAMREAIDEAGRVVEMSARASSESEPLPDLWEFLDDQGRAAYISEVERRRNR